LFQVQLNVKPVPGFGISPVYLTVAGCDWQRGLGVIEKFAEIGALAILQMSL